MKLIAYANRILTSCFLMFLLLPISAISAANELEDKWSSLLKQKLFDKERVVLKAADKEFIGLYLEQTTGKPQGGLIILHGRGVHPNWNQVIKPLRENLPKHGWSTLSIQLPVLETDRPLLAHASLFDAAVTRIQAAIAFMKSKKILNIGIVGYELGATMGAYALKQMANSDIKAYVGISMISTRKNKTLDASLSLALVKTPVLDIYADQDSQEILAGVVERTPLIYQQYGANSNITDPNKLRYRQVSLDGASHSYNGYEDLLIKRIDSWLKVFAPGKTLTTSAL